MINETHYGVISDIHQYPQLISETIAMLKKQGAEKLLLNGDIGNQQGTLQESQCYIGFILDEVGKSGLESYVQPGSHETIEAFEPVIEYFEEKYPNIINVIKNPKVEQNGYDLVFLPGSDFLCGGEYHIGNDPIIPSSNYIQVDKSPNLIMFDVLRNGIESINGMAEISPKSKFEMFHYSNMNDLKKLVTIPEKTIVVCHVPRKFDNLETAVDMAEFGEATEKFNLNGNNIEQSSVFPLPIAQQIVQAGYPVEIRKENRGNKDLKSLYEKLGITKAVSGHFHESGHRANDCVGNHVQEGEMVNDLFWNSGHLDAGQTGILTVGDGKVSYRNLHL